MRHPFLSALAALTFVTPLLQGAGLVKPGEAIDYSKIAFYPERWKNNDLDLELIPWEGKNITFLTVTGNHDPETMTALLKNLDAGWELYAGITGRSPRRIREVNGKAPIAAIPGNGLSCGYGCGFVGATGIEMTHFYDGHYPALQKNPKAVPHAYFYEMGRNYYTFGRKHDCFTTGFAVFMRYVCVQELGLVDNDSRTAKTIKEAIDQYEASDLPFLRTFTTSDGLSEKKNRLKTIPTDQPVMYCSAMLKLWETLGDEWLKQFFRQLVTCPDASSKTKEGAQQQSVNWFLAASCAAKRDLTPIFVGKWRLQLTPEQSAALKKIDWKSPSLKAGEISKSLAK